MTLYAVPGSTDALPDTESPGETALEHDDEHAWRLVQVDYSDGSCVREFVCRICAAVWFA